jgi:hypothetical protein
VRTVTVNGTPPTATRTATVTTRSASGGNLLDASQAGVAANRLSGVKDSFYCGYRVAILNRTKEDAVRRLVSLNLPGTIKNTLDYVELAGRSAQAGTRFA